MDDRTKSNLRRVAQALGVNEDVFCEGDLQHGEAAVQAWSQEVELLRLFAAIADPEVRRSCLEYVRAAAGSADMAPE